MTSDKAGTCIHIAIDGPAASGKSTVAIGLARRLGLALVDSGSMYRAVTLLAIEDGVPVDAGDALELIARAVSRSFALDRDGESLRVFIGEREVTDEIRSTAVGASVSPISEVPRVRDEMVKLQRALVEGRDAVMEGRDIGTTVLPAAALKVFLEAPQSERAKRRFEELRARGLDVSLDQVFSEIGRRDSIDSCREVSPLRMATDAVAIDTTDKTVAEVIDEVAGLVAARGLARQGLR
jgi:cytidylate kinase